MANNVSTFAQNRQVWTPGGIEPGEVGKFDPACASRSLVVDDTADLVIPFGAFVGVSVVSGEERVVEIADAATSMLGIALVSQQGVTDYSNRQYSRNEVAEIGTRGYFYVLVDQDNVPTVGGEVKILSAIDADTGALTSTNTNAREVTNNTGIKITKIADFGSIKVAEVYLSGLPNYILSTAA